MTFEEFFKKKRIDLVALQAGEPLLFAEFNTHFCDMGEKSFDHSKKYWFNKLRHQYPLAAEVKPEKAQLANSLAEQTINESLTEITAPPVPVKTGFVPRFRAAANIKPPENTTDKKGPSATIPETSIPEEKLDEPPVVKPTYKPRFNIKNIPPKES